MTKTQRDRLREAKEKKMRNLSKQNQIIERRKTIKRADNWDKKRDRTNPNRRKAKKGSVYRP